MRAPDLGYGPSTIVIYPAAQQVAHLLRPASARTICGRTTEQATLTRHPWSTLSDLGYRLCHRCKEDRCPPMT